MKFSQEVQLSIEISVKISQLFFLCFTNQPLEQRP